MPAAFNAEIFTTINTQSLNTATREVRNSLGRITGSASEFQKSLDASTARVFAFGATTLVINGITQSFKALVGTTIEVEKRLIGINAIFGGTASEFQAFRDSIFDVAKKTGQSFATVADGAEEFARQGLGAVETAKRLEAALVLTNISGLDSVKSVKTLTAAINGFSVSGLEASQIANKIANVDTKFAVSADDLSDALSRAGSSAQDAGVSFDEFLGLVTAIQVRSQRGGSVIANGLKTIFTRLQRSTTISQLQELGVAIDASQNGVQKLQALASALNGISDPTQASKIKELAAGVFQINTLSTALKDLGKGEASLFNEATLTSANSQNEAYEKNAKIVESISAQINSLIVSVSSLAEKAGQLTFAPLLKNLIGIAESFSGFLDKALDPEKGSAFVQGLFKSIGAFISGPGVVLITGALFKIVSLVAKFAKEGLDSVFKIGTETEKIKSIQEGINRELLENVEFKELIKKGTVSQREIEQAINSAITKRNKLYAEQALALETIAKAAMRAGAVGYDSAKGGYIDRRGRPVTKAGGFVPSFAETLAETASARENGYTAGKVFNTRLYDGSGGSFKATVNSAETIKTVRGPNGKLGTYVIPPNVKSGGYKPNFARGFSPNRIPFGQSDKDIFNAQLGKRNFSQTDLTKQAVLATDKELRSMASALETLQMAVKETSKEYNRNITFSKKASAIAAQKGSLANTMGQRAREASLASPTINLRAALKERMMTEARERERKFPSVAEPAKAKPTPDPWGDFFVSSFQKERRRRTLNSKEMPVGGSVIPYSRIGNKVFDGLDKLGDKTLQTQSALFSLSFITNSLFDSQSKLNEVIQTTIVSLGAFQLLSPVLGSLRKIGGTKLGKLLGSSVGSVASRGAAGTIGSRALGLAGPVGLAIGAGIGGYKLGGDFLKKTFGVKSDLELLQENLASQFKVDASKFQTRIGLNTATKGFVTSGNQNEQRAELKSFLGRLAQEGESEKANRIIESFDKLKEASKVNDKGNVDVLAVRGALMELKEAVEDGRKAINEQTLTAKMEKEARIQNLKNFEFASKKFTTAIENAASSIDRRQTALDAISGVSLNPNAVNSSLIRNASELARGESEIQRSRGELTALFSGSGSSFGKIIKSESEASKIGRLDFERITSSIQAEDFADKLLQSFSKGGASGLRKDISGLTGVPINAESEEGKAFLDELIKATSSFRKNIIQTAQQGENALMDVSMRRLEAEKKINDLVRQKSDIEKKAFDNLPARLKEIAEIGSVDPLTLAKGYRDVAKTKDPLEAARKFAALQGQDEAFGRLRGDEARRQLRESQGLTGARTESLRETQARSQTISPELKRIFEGRFLAPDQRKFVETGVGSKETIEKVAQTLENISKGAGRSKSSRQDAAILASALRTEINKGTADENLGEKKELDKQLKEGAVIQLNLNVETAALTEQMRKFKEGLAQSKGLADSVSSLNTMVVGASNDIGKFADVAKRLGFISDSIDGKLANIQQQLEALKP